MLSHLGEFAFTHFSFYYPFFLPLKGESAYTSRGKNEGESPFW